MKFFLPTRTGSHHFVDFLGGMPLLWNDQKIWNDEKAAEMTWGALERALFEGEEKIV